MNTSLLRNGTALALTTALISGVSVFINKFVVSGIGDPILFSAFKNSLVAVFLVGLVVFLGKHTELRSLNRTQWTRLGLIGLIGGSIPFALFFTGLALIPAAAGAMIHKTLFVWVAILAMIFLKERFSPLQWLGVIALFAANVVIGGFMGFSGSLGEWLVLGATLFWAVENVIAKRALADISSITVASARMVLGSALLFVFLTTTGRAEGILELTTSGFLWTLLTALFLLGYVLTWYSALKLAPASYVAALLVPATLVTNVLSAVFVTGTLTGTQVLSGVLLVFGSILIIRFAKRIEVTAPMANALNS